LSRLRLHERVAFPPESDTAGGASPGAAAREPEGSCCGDGRSFEDRGRDFGTPWWSHRV